jgi:hypothetical protein
MIALVVCLAVASSAFAGVGEDKAVYRGGTIPVRQDAEGYLKLTGADAAEFVVKGERVKIPYTAVTSIEYGQKAGRRVGAAIATAVLVSPVGLFLLMSKKRKHIVTIGWTVDGKNEGAVFELGKNAIRPALATLQARTGKKVEYESAEAQANIGK